MSSQFDNYKPEESASLKKIEGIYESSAHDYLVPFKKESQVFANLDRINVVAARSS